MNKIFWSVCALGLIGAIGLVIGVRATVGGEIGVLRKRIGSQGDKLKVYADKPADVKPPSFVRESNEYLGKLNDAEKSLDAQMKSRNLDLEKYPWDWSGEKPVPGDQPPVDDTAAFRQWLEDRYQWRDAKMKEAGIALPKPADRGDVTEWTFARTEVPGILRNFAVSLEVHDALRAAKAEVRPEGTQPRQVERLLSLTRIMGRRGAGAKKFSEHTFTLSFVAQYNVVAEVVRRLEQSENAFSIVRAVNVSRQSGAKPSKDDAGEAAVEAKVTASLVNFGD